MKVTPHVAHTRCAAAAAMNGRTTRHGGYAVSPPKHIEECLGWLKTIAPKVWEFNELLIHVSFIKSTSGQELPGGDSAWCNRPRLCRSRAPAPTRKFRTHHNVSENGNRVGRPDYPRSAFTPPRPSVPVMQTADSLLCRVGANYIRLNSAGRAPGVSLFSPI